MGGTLKAWRLSGYRDESKTPDGRRVRYLGIDASEMGGAGQPTEPWAAEAKALSQRLVLNRRVRLMRDVSDEDVYGRLLRYVFCDGVFVSGQMLLAGLAWLMIVTPDTRYAALLAGCQAAAQQARVGMCAMGRRRSAVDASRFRRSGHSCYTAPTQGRALVLRLRCSAA